MISATEQGQSNALFRSPRSKHALSASEDHDADNCEDRPVIGGNAPGADYPDPTTVPGWLHIHGVRGAVEPLDTSANCGTLHR